MTRTTLLVAVVAFAAGVITSVATNPRAQKEEVKTEHSRFSLDIAAGQTRLGPSPKGMWWTDADHSNRYKTNGVPQLGLSMKLNPAWAVSARWISLGHASINSLVVSCPDDDCSKSNPANHNRAACATQNAVDCAQRVRGSWGIKGALFSFNAEAGRLGPVSFHPELGVFVYKLRGTARVMPADCTDESKCAWAADIVQQTGYLLSPEVGFMVRYRNFFAGTQYFLRTAQHTNVSPAIGGHAQTWIVGASVEF